MNVHASRQEVRTVHCPECKAEAGQSCTGKAGRTRIANHQGRLKQYASKQPAKRRLSILIRF